MKRHRPFSFWQSVTGSLKDGETHEAAAVRELLEETGLADEGALRFSGRSRRFEIDPRWRHRFAAGVVSNVEYEWRYRLRQVGEIRLNRDEHSEYAWLPVDEAIDTVWSWTNREALEALRDGL